MLASTEATIAMNPKGNRSDEHLSPGRRNLRETRQWHREIFERVGAVSANAQAGRVAFLAVEGLFLLRIVGIDEDGTWAGLLDDIEAVLDRLLDLTGG
ncbi:hypothetical protein J2Y63_006572 [Shinella sp. BE166]|uniref:hypothetical protein n=1 Tax=Shinella sp. BE166 TaxID=3373918 RepID=UPI003EBAF3EA